MVTSSAVVGSSAISSAGLHESAMAIITRWRMPPENWCGYVLGAPARVGDADLREQLHRRPARAVAQRLVCAQLLRDLPADRVDGRQRRHRVLEDHRDLAAAHRAHLVRRQLHQVASAEQDLAPRRPRSGPGSGASPPASRRSCRSRTRRRCRASSPCATVNETPSTARTSPSSVRKLTRRSRTSSRGCRLTHGGPAGRATRRRGRRARWRARRRTPRT